MPQPTGFPAARFRRLPLVTAAAGFVAVCAIILSLVPEWVLFRQRLAFSVFDMEDNAVLRPFDHTTHDGLRLRSWYVPAKDDKPVLVYFPGRDGDMLRKPGHLLELTGDGYGVLLAGYRGYGGNPGIPREFDLYLDAISMLGQFAERVKAPDGFVLYGYSMGTGIATNTAAQMEVDAVILEAPISNFLQAVRQQAGNVPAILVRSRFDNLSRIAEIKAPILLLAGGQDPVTPALFAWALAEANPAFARVEVIDDANHVNIIRLGGRQVVRDFLAWLWNGQQQEAAVARDSGFDEVLPVLPTLFSGGGG